MTNSLTRREFLKLGALSAGSFAFTALAPFAAPWPPDELIGADYCPRGG